MCAVSSAKFLYKQQIQLAPKTGVNAQGEVTYGADVTYLAYVERRNRRTINLAGDEVVSTATVYIYQPDIPLSVEDRITLPDGSQPQILSLGSIPCEVGHEHKQVFT